VVLKILTQGQKDNRKNIYSDIVERITEQPDVLENIIIYGETWIFQYDPETKMQLMTPTSPRMKKQE
jgi:hypothetical protein